MEYVDEITTSYVEPTTNVEDTFTVVKNFFQLRFAIIFRIIEMLLGLVNGGSIKLDF